MEQGLNASLYWQNDDLAHTVSLVPTSAHTREGIPPVAYVDHPHPRETLRLIIPSSPWCPLTISLSESLQFFDVLQCTVLEVKVVDGLGHTVDVVLVNGDGTLFLLSYPSHSFSRGPYAKGTRSW
jgi:translation initiation factor 5B